MGVRRVGVVRCRPLLYPPSHPPLPPADGGWTGRAWVGVLARLPAPSFPCGWGLGPRRGRGGVAARGVLDG